MVTGKQATGTAQPNLDFATHYHIIFDSQLRGNIPPKVRCTHLRRVDITVQKPKRDGVVHQPLNIPHHQVDERLGHRDGGGLLHLGAEPKVDEHLHSSINLPDWFDGFIDVSGPASMSTSRPRASTSRLPRELAATVGVRDGFRVPWG